MRHSHSGALARAGLVLRAGDDLVRQRASRLALRRVLHRQHPQFRVAVVIARRRRLRSGNRTHSVRSPWRVSPYCTSQGTAAGACRTEHSLNGDCSSWLRAELLTIPSSLTFSEASA